MNKQSYTKIGEAAFAKMEKVNSELFSIVYGSFVSQLLKDCENVEVVNEKLEKIGHNIGTKLIDEFFCKTQLPLCESFPETIEVLAKVGFKMFLGITADAQNWNDTNTHCSLVISDNPFCEFASLPPTLRQLHYCNMLIGIIKGALGAIRIEVECHFEKDILQGDDYTQIDITLIGVSKEVFIDDLD